eukprot:Nitzschia sp. Nitz4//scaffold178_size73299//70095//70256//NITZ4_005722-RA/size73299-exonerate_est2genome-gene-0.15-mRNA-1//-1//CDS//3329539191//5372//frame0
MIQIGSQYMYGIPTTCPVQIQNASQRPFSRNQSMESIMIHDPSVAREEHDHGR